MATVDNRVVQMEFDNKQFEQGIGTSIKSLGDLRTALNQDLKGNFDQLSSSLDGMSGGFNKLETIATGALLRIGSEITNITMKAYNMLMVRPKAEGFDEYELKLRTIQTIMFATGEAAGVVEDKIRSLDEYADKTIYSTRDMFDNLATFTNSGVALDDATNAMIGIANATAIAGQQTQAATYAYRNFSDGIANGYMSLMDFRSISRVAKIATQEFRGEVLEAAVRVGTLRKNLDGTFETVDGGVKVTKQFEDTLKEQWFTADVITNVLGQYADQTTDVGARSWRAAQEVRTFTQMIDTLQAAVTTSWSQSFEIIIGTLEESRQLWTYASESISLYLNSMGDARNEALKFWKEGGGREQLIYSLVSIAQALQNVLKPIQAAFREIFPPQLGQTLLNITDTIGRMTYNFKTFTAALNENNRLTRTFRGLFAVIDIVRMVFTSIIELVTRIVGLFTGGGNGLVGAIMEGTATVGDFITGIRNFLKEGDVFGQVVDNIVGFVAMLVIEFQNFINMITNTQTFKNILQFFKDLGDNIATVFKNFDIGDAGISVMERVQTILGNFASFVGPIGTKIKDGLIKIKDALVDFVKNFSASEFGQNVIGAFQGVIDAFKWVWDRIKAIIDWAKPIVNQLVIVIEPIIKRFGDRVKEFFMNITSEDVNALLKGGVIAAIIFGLKQLKDIFSPAGKMLGGITKVLNTVADTLEAYQTRLKADSLLKIGGAVALLAVALVALGGVDSERLAKGTSVIVTLFASLAGATAVMGKAFAGKGAAGIGLAMLELAAAVALLGMATNAFGKMDVDILAQGLIGVGIALLEFATFTKLAGGYTEMSKIGWAMVELSAALLIMSLAIKSYGNMDVSVLSQGLLGVGVAILEFAVFVKLAGGATHLAAIGFGLLELVIAIKLLIGPLQDLASMDTESLTKGLGAIGALLLELATFTALVGGTTRMIAIATGLIVMAGVMYLLVQALLKVAQNMTPELTDAMVSFGVVMVSLAGAAAIMQLVPIVGALSAAAGLIVLTAAMAAVLFGLGGLYQIPGAEKVFNDGGRALGAIGTAIGAFVGGIIYGISAASVAGLAKIGEQLSLFTENAKGFFEGMAQIGPETISGLGYFITAMMDISKIKDDALQDINFAAFGTQMSLFAPHLMSFYNQVKNIDPSIMNAAANAITAIFGIDLPNQGGIAAYWAGDNDLATVAEGLIPFAENLKTASVHFTGMDFQAVIDGANAAATLFGIQIPNQGGLLGVIMGENDLATVAEGLIPFALNLKLSSLYFEGVNTQAVIDGANTASVLFGINIPNQGGLLAAITGDNDLATVAQGLIPFASGLKSASLLFKDVDYDAVAAGAEAATLLFSVEIPNQGGFVGWIVGNNDFGTVSEGLVEFGKALVSYSNSVDGIKPDAIIAANNAIRPVFEMANLIPNQGGVLKEYTGDNTLKEFAKQLPDFGKNIAKYYKSVSKIESFNGNGAIITLLRGLVEIMNIMPNSGGVAAFFAGDNSIGAIAKQLPTLGQNLVRYSESLDGLDTTNFFKAKDALLSLVDLMNQTQGVKSTSLLDLSVGLANMAQNGVTNFIKTFTDNYMYAYDTGVNFIQSIINGLSLNLLKFQDLGTQYGADFANLFHSQANKNKAEAAGRDIANSVQTGLKAPDWKKVGEDSVLGYIEGLKSKLNDAKQAGKDLGNASLEGTNEALDRASPSKEYIEIGEDVVEGYDIGIEENLDEAEETGEKLAETTLKGTAKFTDKFLILGQEAGENLNLGIQALGGAIRASFEEIFEDEQLREMTATLDEALSTIEDRIASYTEIATDRMSKMNVDSETSINDMIENLVHNQRAITEWANGIAKLSESGLAEGILEELRAGGPQTIGEVQAIVNATEEEIERLNELFEKGGSVAKQALVTSIAADPAMVEQLMAEGQNMAQIVANGLVGSTSLNSAMQVLISGATAAIETNQIPKLIQAGANISKTVGQGAGANTQPMKDASEKNSEAFVKGQEETGVKSIEEIMKDLDSEYATKTFEAAAANSANSYVDGFIKGINDRAGEIKDAAAKAVGESAEEGTDEELEIESPSKVARRQANFYGLGFVQGIKEYGNRVYSATQNMGTEAVDGIRGSISYISKVLGSELDLQPTIRPVVDLTDLEAGSNLANNMFNKTTLNTRTGLNLARSAAASFRSMAALTTDQIQAAEPTQYNLTQNNYSPKALSRLDIYRQTRNQFSQLKGLVNTR